MNRQDTSTQSAARLDVTKIWQELVAYDHTIDGFAPGNEGAAFPILSTSDVHSRVQFRGLHARYGLSRCYDLVADFCGLSAHVDE
jgi:hypothetical protein